MRLDWFIYHVASGHAFFTGLALVAIAVAVSTFAREKSRWRRLIPILVVLGVLLVAASATPLPWLAYAAIGACFLLWVAAESSRDRLSKQRVKLSRGLLIAALFTGAAFEFPYHVTPKVSPGSARSLAIIADSITAGMGENEAVTWPKIIAERHQIAVHDHSAMGATVASARKQAAKLQPDDDVVLLEIGGNDLLGSTSANQFEQGLETLLDDVAQPGRTVLMFELPLPPSFNRFGSIQRRLAAKYDVLLIPKRVLMGVLTGQDATLDTIHLSQAGQDRMAEVVWRIVAPAFQRSSAPTTTE